MATSLDLVHWKRQGVIMPAYKGKWNVGWTKSGAIVSEKIGGKYWMYYLADAAGHEQQMGVAYSTDLPPVMTPDGIFLVYNGADDNLVYSTGWVLFDKKDPSKVLARTQQPVFKPVPEWERVGQVPNVVFVEGLVRDRDRWMFYYGGADKYIGVAAAPAL